MAQVILETRALGARYDAPDGGDEGHEVFAGLDLAIMRGEFVSVVGPSGCGKTTLLHILAGLMKPAGGEVCLHDEPRVAVMFQRPTLIPWRRVLENVLFGAECMGLDADKERARALLESMGLGEAIGHRPHQLSEGMKQRVNLARALFVQPDLLLLDEPTEHLDDASGSELVRRLLDREDDLIDRARIVVLVTHQLPPDTRADLVIDLGVSPPEKSRKNPLRSSISGRTLTSTRERRWSEVDEL